MSKEKKNTIILTVILSLICAGLIAFLVVDTLKENGTIASKEVNEIMEEFNEIFNSKERKVILYASTGCIHCELQKPILETIAEDYDMEYFEVDSALLGAKQKNQILEKLEMEKHATPTTVIVQNGKVIDKVIGYKDGKEYVEFFATNEMIPEDAVYSAEAYLTFVTYSDYKEIISKNDLQIVVVGQTGCSHCTAIKPALNKIAGEYNITINYLNLTDMTREDYNSFSQSLKDIEYNEPEFVESGSFGTPLTLIIENGKVKDYISGERTKSQLVREFKKSGIISE